MAMGTIETDIRKEQHGAEKQWKETGRSTKSDLKHVCTLYAVISAAMFCSHRLLHCSYHRSTWLLGRSRLTFARNITEPKSSGRKLDALLRVT